MRDDGDPRISEEIVIAELLKEHRTSQDRMIHTARSAARASAEGRAHGVEHCQQLAVQHQKECVEIAGQLQELLADATSVLLYLESYGDIPQVKRGATKQTMETARAKRRRPVLVNDCDVPVTVVPASFELYPRHNGQYSAVIKHARFLLSGQNVYLHRIRAIAVQGTISRAMDQPHSAAVCA